MKVFIFAISFILLSCNVEKPPEVETRYVETIVEIEKYNDLLNVSIIPPMESFRISSSFGFRENPMGGGEFNMHKGLDLVGPKNSPVIAVMDGVVVENWPPPNGYFKGHPIYGGLIIIKHANGLYSLYAHLSKGFVKTNMKVKQGDAIGIQGSTGISTGDHLHFELLLDPSVFLANR
jgi:murein DD-endopeptidase MepM/ murein hydrolase activator NlpD